MKLKRVLIATALLSVTGAATAAGLSWTELSTSTRTEAFNPNGLATGLVPDYGGGAGVGSTVSLGYLSTDGSTPGVAFTYLGHESAYNNNFKLTVAPGTEIQDSSAIGTSATLPVSSAGALSFRFEGDTGSFAYNDGSWCSTCSIGLIATNETIGGTFYQYVIGYNDSAGNNTTLGDWDDMVIGVSAVPEPETYAMLMAGLGLMGFMARRRKQQSGTV